MGGKLITEKDFWMCSEGAVPAPFQGTHLSLKKKKGGEVFITVADKATASWIDFGCKKYMLLAAIAIALVAVALVVAGVVTIATGGLGLFAIGAIAGVVGGTIGAVVGGLLCGQKMVSKREWLTSGKANFISQGANTITSEHKMICPIGGEITFAPQVKNWMDAILMAGASYASSLIECAMTGGMIGSIGGSLVGSGGLLAGAKALFGQGWKAVGKSVLGFLKNTPKVVLSNLIKKDASDVITTACQSLLGSYGTEGKLTYGSVVDAAHEVFLGDVDSVKNIFTGNGSLSDITSVVGLMVPGDSGGKKNKNANTAEISKVEGGSGHTDSIDSSHAGKSESTNSPESMDTDSHKVKQESERADGNKSEGAKIQENSTGSSQISQSPESSDILDDTVTTDQHKTIQGDHANQTAKHEPSDEVEDKSSTPENKSQQHQNDNLKSKENRQKKEGETDSPEKRTKAQTDSDSGKKTIGEEAEAYCEGGDKHIDTPTLPITPDPPFKKNPEHSSEEFNRQLKDQQDAINKMKTKEWLANRESFENRDKADHRKRAKEARDKYRKQEIKRRTKEYMRNNPQASYIEAQKAAQQSMRGQAALHNPDGVAGGDIDQISGMGDSRVNSSIGAQWGKGRAASIESQIKQHYGIPPKTISDIPDNAMMNVNLF